MTVSQKPAISRQTASTLYLAISIIGVLLLVASIVLIVIDQRMVAPYLTGISGICLVIASVVARRALAKV